MSPTRGNTIQVSRTLRADPQQAFDVVYDVEYFPMFMPNVTAARVISNDGDRKTVEWEMLIDGAPLNWTEDIRYDRDLLTADFKALDGVFSHFDGTWRVWVSANGTNLEVSVFYDLGLPEIEDIIGPILEERLRQNLDAMLYHIDAMLENIEARVGST
uniref:Coenzyme Q-binding protein COQ10 START domain-containing protein n=1 Tax=mine drainage metagenome TaxID=410659 RepID=E6QWN0_9ZZZZ